MIYEGTNHIQALDLVGRKLPDGMGRMYQKFAAHITKFIQANKENKELEEFIEPIKDASKKLNEATMGLSMRGMQDPEEAGAVQATTSTSLHSPHWRGCGAKWQRSVLARTISSHKPS